MMNGLDKVARCIITSRRLGYGSGVGATVARLSTIMREAMVDLPTRHRISRECGVGAGLYDESGFAK